MEELRLIKSQESYKLTVTQDLEKKIRFLCNKLPNNEWSGTLFYTIEGSFADKNLHVICKDFYLQDVGESTFTEFQRDASLAAYMVDHDLLDCYSGLMHSHNIMSTFFSGTDMATLREEGTDTNHFLSLIVNNKGDYTAYITRKITANIVGEKNVQYNTFGNEPVIAKENVESQISYIEYYPLEITVEKVPEEQKSELELRLEEVRNSSNSYINRKFSSYEQNSFATFQHHNTMTENKHKGFDYNQNYMFSNKEMGVPEKKEDIEHIDKEIIDNNITQIITGDIFSPYKQNIDIGKWAINMSSLYDKRFGDDTETFRFWVDSFIDFLEEDLNDNHVNEDRDVIDSMWANDLIERLSSFPTNKYLIVFIKSLKRWII